LQPEAFKKVLKVKNKMKKNKIGDFLLAMVNTDGSNNGKQDWKKLYRQISKEIRMEDYLGLLDDNLCYILFSQADQTNENGIYLRLEQHGISCNPVVDPVVDQLESSFALLEMEPGYPGINKYVGIK